MANTVFGPYAKTVWTNGATPANQTNMSNLETQASVALNGFNGDLFTAFVLTGVTCTKDGTNANQLDIAAGRAYVTMSDGTRGLIIVAADNTHTTSALSSTYHLWLQPDGSWYWNTANTPAANSLHICDVTTDGSGNIVTVTDQRQTRPLLMSGAAFAPALQALYADAGAATTNGSGMLTIAKLTSDAGAVTTNGAGLLTATKLSSDAGAVTTNGSGLLTATKLSSDAGAVTTDGAGDLTVSRIAGNIGTLVIQSQQSGATAQGVGLYGWSGSVRVASFSAYGQISGAPVYVDTNGKLNTTNAINTIGGQATAGSFGAPVIVAQAINVLVTATTLQTILSYTPPTAGLYRVSIYVSMGNGTGEKILAQLLWGDPNLGTPTTYFASGTFNTSTALLLSGSLMSQTVGPNQSISPFPTTIYAGPSAAIQVQYQDSAGTPNDHISALIERLS